MERFEHNGLSLEYKIQGQGVPFVFLHGMGGSVTQIDNTYLPIEGVQLITLNQEGHGESDVDWEHYDFDYLADDVIALMDQLGIEKAYFGGISMGAAVSLNIAVRYPERVMKLLLIRNAWLDMPMAPDRRQAYADMGDCLRDRDIERFYQTAGWQIVKEHSAYTKGAFTCTFSEEPNIKNWQKYFILPSKQPIPNREVLSQLTMPVYIIANRNDFCHPFEYGEFLHQMIAHSEFYEVPDKDKDSAGHKTGINQVIRKMIERSESDISVCTSDYSGGKVTSQESQYDIANRR